MMTATDLTHCKWGHEYTPENTRWQQGKDRRRPVRLCEECRRKRIQAKRDAAKRPVETSDPAVLLCREEWAKRKDRLMAS